MPFGQIAASSQFFLYGKRHCTATGYERHRAEYLQAAGGADLLDDPSLTLQGKVCIVTGANSGVGLEVTKFLASKGATLYMFCRSAGKGEEARKKIVEDTGNEDVSLIICDCGLEADVRRAWAEFKTACGGPDGAPPPLHAVVCNAGVLLNELTTTAEDVEVTFGCHLLFGTYLLGTLAADALQQTPGSRLVVVSSGGMYNTKWPGLSEATSRGHRVSYNGELVYAFAKRGQVLLCEQWAAAMPAVKFVSAHPGWTQTPAVDAAFGDRKKYLEPLRTPWQGAEGIAWLCVAPAAELESGAFYLDRTTRAKHIAGPFFTEGSYTKNTPEEIASMMSTLELWASASTRPRPPTPEELAEAEARDHPLVEMERPIEISKFVGRWFVIAQIPTMFDKGAMNSIEDYKWDGDNERVEVSFMMQSGPDSPVKTVLQRAAMKNANRTRWSLSPKLGIYLPLGLAYLVVDCAEDYSTCIVGDPKRSFLYIMAREQTVDEQVLDALLDKSARTGHDMSKVERVVHTYPEAGPPPFSY